MKIKKDYLKVAIIMGFVLVVGALGKVFESEPEPEPGNSRAVASDGPTVTTRDLAPATTSGDSGEAVTLIPYEVRTSVDDRFMSKLNLTIEVPLVDGRLPSKSEMNAIAEHLVGTPRRTRTWVAFLLPGMPDDAGAYATAHYLPCGGAIDCPEGSPPQPEGVKLVPFGLLNTDYAHLDPDSIEVGRAAKRARENPAAAAKERAQLLEELRRAADDFVAEQARADDRER